jgi:hypothetical protein
MDTNAQALEQALAVLREQFQGQLAGGMKGGLVAMRQALQTRMGIDELEADRVVKKLAETGRLRYVGGEATDDDEVNVMRTGTGPALIIPGTTAAQGGGPVAVPATTALAMGAINNPQGVVGGPVTGSAAAAAAGDEAHVLAPRDTTVADQTPAKVAENLSGATMGNLADTNVEPPRINDATGGYWQIA